MSDLFRIVYCSRNALPEAEPIPLEDILAISRRNNAREEVTGALLCSSGNFAQVLEGPFDAVQRTFERIQTDDRHEDVILLHAEQTEIRMFGEWTMALANAASPEIANEALRAAMLRPGEHAAVELTRLLETLVRRDEWAPA